MRKLFTTYIQSLQFDRDGSASDSLLKMALEMESCSFEELCESLGGSEKLITELRERLEDWLKLQPHLPQDIPKVVLEHFIFGTKLSLEQAKQKLDMFYTMRRLVPELHADRDPHGRNLANLHSKMQIAFLPKLTPEKYRVCIFRPIADNYSEFTAADGFKYCLMMEEMLMNDIETRCLGIIHIIDHTKINVGFLAKYTPPIIKKFEVAITEAYARRIKALIHVNVGPITEVFLSVIKSAIKPKLAARLSAHGKGSYDALHRQVPKSILPVEYGGDQQSMAELTEYWRLKVSDKRDWFMEQEKIMVDERLRPGPTLNVDHLFGFAGSFRNLDVD